MLLTRRPRSTSAGAGAGMPSRRHAACRQDGDSSAVRAAKSASQLDARRNQGVHHRQRLRWRCHAVNRSDGCREPPTTTAADGNTATTANPYRPTCNGDTAAAATAATTKTIERDTRRAARPAG